MKRAAGLALSLTLGLTLRLMAADEPAGSVVFGKNCAVCHEHPQGRIPPTSALRKLTPAAIQAALETGVMRSQGATLTAAEKSQVAAFLGVAPVGAVAVAQGRCAEPNAWPAPDGKTDWTGWGAGAANWRFQSSEAAGLSASAVPRLKLRWAFGLPGTVNMRSQPAVYRERVFIGGGDGTVYALNAASGCTYWATKVGAMMRTGIALGVAGGQTLAVAGDVTGSVYALDAASGKLLWKRHLDDHPAAMVTATPVIHEGLVYVGTASYEETLPTRPDYVCCTFRGSVSALRLEDGTVVWKTYTIPKQAAAQPDNKRGKKVMGPSGAGVWAAITVDAARGLLYVPTGDNYSDPPTDTSDAVLALSLGDGQLAWKKQLTTGDAYNSSCAAGPNCPDSAGPDHDLGGSAMLVNLAGGRRALLVGQKSGVMHALDPDRKGEAIWDTRIGKGGPLGGIQWGPATDGRQVYVPLSDIAFRGKPGGGGFEPDPAKGGGLFALNVTNGEIVWRTPNPDCGARSGCSPAQSAAVTAIPGVVFSGSMDGHLRAYDTQGGKIVWDFGAAREFTTVNGVKATGGAFDTAGAAVAGGMVFAGSGYAQWGGAAGNVLLAFGPE